jgi:hypothetical protein
MSKSVRRMVGKQKTPDIGTFDIETKGLTGKFICGMTYFNEEYKLFRKKGELFQELLNHPGVTWFAHNGVRFDFTYFVPEFKAYANKSKHPSELISSGDEVIGIVLRADKKKDDMGA